MNASTASSGGATREPPPDGGNDDDDDDDDDGDEVPSSDTAYQLSVRSIVVGGLVGSVVTAANIWVGLKTGWAISPSLFAAILGFFLVRTTLDLVLKYSPSCPVREFGPKENCILQTTGVAAGGLTAGFQMAIPALAWLGYSYSYGALTLWVISAAYFGLFFAIPLRSYAIIHRQLRFPTGTATAYAIHNIHATATGGDLAKSQARWMIYVFGGAFLWIVMSAYVPVLYNMPVLYYLSKFGWSWAWQATQWRWSLNFSPAFVGTGMLMGTRVALSYALGATVAYGIIGPLLVHHGIVVSAWGYSDPINKPSSQYWLLWPGITFLLVSCFAELVVNLDFAALWSFIVDFVWYCRTRQHSSLASPRATTAEVLFQSSERDRLGEAAEPCSAATCEEEDAPPPTPPTTQQHQQQQCDQAAGVPSSTLHDAPLVARLEDGLPAGYDPAPPHEQVPWPWWSVGLLLSVALSIAVLVPFFGLVWYEVVLSLVLGFVFSFIAVQATGETDINPMGTVGKASQLVFAGVSPGQIDVSLIAANVAAASASQSVDMLQDLKTGVLLRASPRAQFVAQLFGSMFGVVLSVSVYKLMETAYPCLVDINELQQCPFQAPAALAWYGFAIALNSGSLSNVLPPYCGWAILTAASLGCVFPIVSRMRRRKYAWCVPSSAAIGLAFIGGQPYLGITVVSGALGVELWQAMHASSCTKYFISVATGMATGEGVGGVVVALLTIVGLVHEWCIGLPPSGQYSC